MQVLQEGTIQDVSPWWELIGETAVFLWKDWPRNMRVTVLDSQTNKFSLSGTCPHCDHDSVFMMVGQSPHALSESNHYSHDLRVVVSAMQCQGCLWYILGIIQYNRTMGRVEQVIHYPLGKPDDKVAEEIPEEIGADFSEALRCRWVDAYNATVEMCRRALEAGCLVLGAPKADVLEDMIDWLADQRIITPFQKQVAHKIRLGGNRGAHPELVNEEEGDSAPDQPITKIEQEHADAVIQFTREFFHHVFVVPKQLDKYDFSKPKKSKKVIP